MASVGQAEPAIRLPRKMRTMPTYQYRCKDCSSELEVVQKFTDAALTECPRCRGDLRKVYNAVGVVFKGSGFYATDSRSKNTSTSAASTGSGDSGASGSSSSDSSASGSSSSTPSASTSSAPASSAPASAPAASA